MSKKKKRKKIHYNERLWLNPEESGSTGSIVCFDGRARWSRENEQELFVEVADCHQKARLHICRGDSHKDWYDKVTSMRNALNRYLVHLEKNLKHRKGEK